MSFFFDWHSKEKQTLSDLRFRLIALVTVVTASSMAFLDLFASSTLFATVVALAIVVLGSVAICCEIRAAKAALVASLLVIEYLSVASLGATFSNTLALIFTFLVLDAILLWLLVKKE